MEQTDGENLRVILHLSNLRFELKVVVLWDAGVNFKDWPVEKFI